MKRDYKLYFQDIKESIAHIESYLRDVSQEDFYTNRLLQDAVVRRLEIIGEATKNLPRLFKEKNKHVPWSKMSSFRDFIVHSYFEASLESVWNTSTKKLPEIKKLISSVQFI